ncbi:hypothetical protein MT355_20490 [Rathayibacter sp. VKM Ac-2929]|uniref:hypothetical protein n=1 Tax=Rathayibacter sp. VKM Ac-2929 TaxID=2929480 RepID=UPI001FB2CB31|nr:hypothetical protein [Rathayibacter sp. VKM Ac-2929]MCJ1675652.1 hypothetical protein [Rathayibacter sp. VKM Ac-2929]
MDVELLAVNEVNAVVGRCQRLHSEITVGDKTPFTDGHIDVYTSAEQSNRTWQDRVFVQVKGRKKTTNKNSTPKFSVDRSALLAYRRTRGVLYFFVPINAKTGKGRVYYSILTPFKIQGLLDDHPESQQAIPIALKAFPANVQKVQEIIVFAAESQRQDTEAGFDAILLENMQSITIRSLQKIDFSKPVTLSPATQDLLLTLTTSNGLSVPMSGIIQFFPPEYTERPLGVDVRGGAETFDSATVQRVSEDQVRLRLSPGLEILIRTTGTNLAASVNLEPESDLYTRLRSLNFFASIIDNRSLYIGDSLIPFSADDLDYDAQLRAHLSGLTELAELCDFLDVDKTHVDVDKISTAEIAKLLRVRRSLIDGEDQELEDDDLGLVELPIGDRTILLLALKADKLGFWRFVDPFSPTEPRQFAWRVAESGKMSMITAYDAIRPGDFATALNLKLRNIVAAYETNSGSDLNLSLANRSVLWLLEASDAEEKRRDELLSTAEALSAWLIEQDPGDAVYQINYWQAISRREALTPEHRKDIRALRRRLVSDSSDKGVEMDFACAALLGDKEELAELVDQLTDEQLGDLKEWPIWEIYTRTAADASQHP